VADVIQGLWVGRPLSGLERLSITSFLRHGHEYHLYCYDDVGPLPAGVVLKDGNAILPASEIFRYSHGPERGSLSAFSNLFRYRLLQERGGWWADTDAVCLRPWDFPAPVVVASESTQDRRAKVANGVMKLPEGHPVAASCYGAASRVDRGTVQWGQIGSALLTRALVENNLLHVIMKPEVFCPLPWWDWHLLLAEDSGPARAFVTGDSYSIHLWQEMWRRAGLDEVAGVPPASSLVGQLLEHFEVEW
jgi:hypothetical protein